MPVSASVLPQKILRQGLECREYIWKVVQKAQVRKSRKGEPGKGESHKGGLTSRLHLWAPGAQSHWEPCRGTLELTHGGWKNPLPGSQAVKAALYILLRGQVTVDSWPRLFALLLFCLSISCSLKHHDSNICRCHPPKYVNDPRKYLYRVHTYKNWQR